MSYHPNYAVDGDPKTAWNEGGPTDGPGEWLRIPVTRQRGVSRVRLRLLDGFHYSKQIYAANSRAKNIEVRLLPGKAAAQRFTLEDKMAWQEIAFDAKAELVDAIELRVVDVYRGASYKDLAISEVEVYVTSTSPEDPELEQQNAKSLAAWATQHYASLLAFRLAHGPHRPWGRDMIALDLASAHVRLALLAEAAGQTDRSRDEIAAAASHLQGTKRSVEDVRALVIEVDRNARSRPGRGRESVEAFVARLGEGADVHP